MSANLATVFVPEQEDGLYQKSAIVNLDDNRPRYLYVAALATEGHQIDLGRDNLCITRIPQCKIVRIVQHVWPDPCLDETQIMSYAKVPLRRDQGDVVPRDKSVKLQVDDLIGRYRSRGLVQLRSPEQIDEQLLPAGWRTEFAVEVIDFLLNPVKEDRPKMTERTMKDWLDHEAPERVKRAMKERVVPSPQFLRTRDLRDAVTLPDHLVEICHGTLKEMRAALQSARAAISFRVAAARTEIRNSKTRIDAPFRGQIDLIEEWAFDYLDEPTPIKEQVEYEKKEKQSFASAVSEGIKEVMQGFRPPAPEPVATEEEIERRAEQRAQETVKKMMPDLIANIQDQIRASMKKDKGEK